MNFWNAVALKSYYATAQRFEQNIFEDPEGAQDFWGLCFSVAP
ncbi:MAG: hypothetical protein ACOYYJ_21805 [Chloroflexota bacterium]